MATIRERGTKWEAQIRWKGYRPISRSFDSRSDAKTWARRTEVSLELGDLSLPERSETSVTLRVILERYPAQVTNDKRGQEPETYRLKRFLKHAICTKRVEDVTPKDFADLPREISSSVS